MLQFLLLLLALKESLLKDHSYETKVRKSLNLLRTVNYQQADSVVLSTLTLALIKWNVPHTERYVNALFDRLDECKFSFLLHHEI